MTRHLVALALIATSGIAHAQLSFTQLSSASRTEIFNVANLPAFGLGTTVSLGALSASQAGTVQFTYLGQESGYNDAFHLTVNNTHLYESNPVGTSVSAAVTSGNLNFRFEGNVGLFANNGPMSGWAAGTSIGLIGTNMTVGSGGGAGTYAFVLGFNDSAGAATLGDWDDFVVGVNFTPVASPVPEPETYGMLLAGLGLLGFHARRRRRAAS